MPKTKVKRHGTTKSRSSKRSASSVSSAGSTNKAKAKPSAAKPARATKGAKPARAAKATGASGIDPRVLAAIGLALEDEAQAGARADLLSQPESSWVALGRVRAVRTN